MIKLVTHFLIEDVIQANSGIPRCCDQKLIVMFAKLYILNAIGWWIVQLELIDRIQQRHPETLSIKQKMRLSNSNQIVWQI